MNDKKLIQNYLSWDEQSLERLLERHLQSIYASCFRVCLDETDANDITQNVLLKIIKNINRFNFESEFKTWYYRIAYNESITFLKKKKIYINIEEVENIIISKENTSQNIDNSILKEDISKEINKLPVIDRNIILYFYYDDLKIKEIAKILDKNENTIKTKISRIKKKLKINLEKYENINQKL